MSYAFWSCLETYTHRIWNILRPSFLCLGHVYLCVEVHIHVIILILKKDHDRKHRRVSRKTNESYSCFLHLQISILNVLLYPSYIFSYISCMLFGRLNFFNVKIYRAWDWETAGTTNSPNLTAATLIITVRPWLYASLQSPISGEFDHIW